MTEFDGVLRSGREDLPLSERIGLLRVDSAWLGGMEPSGPGFRGGGDFVHDLRCLYAYINDLVYTCERKPTWGEGCFDDGTPRVDFVSRLECRALAWRRGGHQEERRVWRLQNEARRTR